MKYSEKMIQDAIRGKEEAIELLYNRTYSNVHFIIANFVKDTDDALDLIMNTYVSGFQNLHMLTDASEFGEWIETIAQNQVLHYLKKKNNVKYENITIEDISRVCELGLSNNTRSKIKPNQRLLELIENECVFYDDADDYDMGNVQEIIEHEKKRREEKRIRKEHIREQEQKFAEEHPDEYEEDRTDTILKVIIAVAAVAAVALLVGVVGIFILKGHNSSDNSNNVTETTQNQEDKQNKIVDNDGQEVIPTPTRIPLGKSTGDSEEQNVTATPVPTYTPMPTATPLPTATPMPTATPIPVPTQDDSIEYYDPDSDSADIIEYNDDENQDNGYFVEHNVQEETFNY